MEKQKRKYFYIDGDKEKKVGACGVLVYRFKNGNMELLLAESRGMLEDLGGHVDENDKDMASTASREAFEESNGLLDKRKIKNRIKNETPVHMVKMKYAVFIAEANEEESKLKSSDFGDIEEHDNIERKIKWYPLDTILVPEVFKYKLAWRLKSKTLFDKLKQIRNLKKFDVNVFSSSSEEKRK